MRQDRLQERLLRYIACDSESGNERAFCQLIEGELRALGLTVSRDEAGALCGSDGWNVYGFLPGEGEPLLLCAHMDTVSPGRGIRPVLGEDGVLRSSGDTILGADDKSGVAAIVEVLARLREEGTPHRPVEVLFTICEESGLLGARHADYSRLKSRQAAVLDSGRPHVIINRTPIHEKLEVSVTGLAAHAGVCPEKGINALKAAAQAVAAIPCGRVDEITMANIAEFHAPGSLNQVPDRVQFKMEVRSHREQNLQSWIDRAHRELEQACAQVGARFTMERARCTGAVSVPEDSPLIRMLVEIYRELDFEAGPAAGFGGSDTAWLFANGIEAVNLGTGMGNLHSVDEFIRMEDLERVTRVLEKLAAR